MTGVNHTDWGAEWPSGARVRAEHLFTLHRKGDCGVSICGGFFLLVCLFV